MALFAASAVALYAAHHVGDYWVQTDHQAQHKGAAGSEGRWACLWHVLTYVATQWLFLTVLELVAGQQVPDGRAVIALLVSGVTHWMADRREHGALFWLARRIPGKARFLMLGAPRSDVRIEIWDDCPTCKGTGNSGEECTSGKCWDCQAGGKLPHWVGDNPSLGTGAWALDQAWHIFWSVFVAALVIAS